MYTEKINQLHQYEKHPLNCESDDVLNFFKSENRTIFNIFLIGKINYFPLFFFKIMSDHVIVCLCNIHVTKFWRKFWHYAWIYSKIFMNFFDSKLDIHYKNIKLKHLLLINDAFSYSEITFFDKKLFILTNKTWENFWWTWEQLPFHNRFNHNW